MQRTLLSLVATALTVSTAYAADLRPVYKAPPAPVAAPSMFDIAFGAALMSDYNFRGISQSDRAPSVFAYFEPRFKIMPNVELYAGLAGYSTKLPTDPTGEFDIYGGIRPTFGPVTFDFGALYYAYPNETQVFLTGPFPAPAILAPTPFPFTVDDTDFLEFYAKVSWTVNDYFTIGGGVFYADDYLQTGADATYASGTAKLTLPSTMLPSDFGIYFSGELGHYWFGTANNVVTGGLDFDLGVFDYTYWNLGVAFTYKVLTLDLRYHDTDLTRAECFGLTADLRGLPGGNGTIGESRWCSEAFIAKIAFDTTLNAFK
jgi:hypothetical protein